jgi:DNA-binding response OmpR family regulator
MFQPDHIEYGTSRWSSDALRPSRRAGNLILCIDDEVRNLEMRKLLLQSAGHNVVARRNGKTGLAAFDSMPVRLVLLDYSMPGLNGAQVAQAMRKIKPHVPILMLSGHSVRPDNIDEYIDLYLVKGGDPRKLLDSVQRLLAKRYQPNSRLLGSMSKASGDDQELLNSWKEVAQYMRRGVRTVQRWEKDLGFPVHRPAGKLKSAVLAVTTEIDEWIRTAPNARSM